jgi:FKBP-type peptidyl-prolyl cis-trans isomerase 2/predicted Fe-Mo cluster-binding NifX family protein
MLVAVPSEAPGGLDALIADHFGHCEVFTLVEIDGGTLGAVTVLPNQEHSEGGCLAPVTLLKERGADALVTGGLGARPLAGFQQVGITIYHKGEAQTVREAVEGVISGNCPEFGEQHTCGHGGCSHDHHHHQEPTAGKIVDGPVQKGLFVQVSYRLTDEAGTLLDESDSIGYVQGAGQLVAGLERALEGRSAGERVEVKVTPEDGYGERSDERMMKVPVAELPPGVAPGASLQAQLPNGMFVPLTVVAIEGDEATLDANHPLAGQTLCFDVRVLSVHEAVMAD